MWHCAIVQVVHDILVILCHCASGFWHFKLWHCVTVQVVHDILWCDTAPFCQWFLAFWDVIMCHCTSGSWHFKLCHYVTVQVVPDILWCDTASGSWHFEKHHYVIVKVVPDILRSITMSLWKWFLTFWEVSMCHCENGSWHFEKCHCVIVQVVPYILRCDSVYCASGSWHFEMRHCVSMQAVLSGFWHLERWQASLSGSSTVWPWCWGCHEPSKCQKPLSQWHIITFQKTCTLMVMYLWVQCKMGKFLTSWATVSFSKGTAVLTI